MPSLSAVCLPSFHVCLHQNTHMGSPSTADVSVRAGDHQSAGASRPLQSVWEQKTACSCPPHITYLKEDQASRTFVSETFLERGCDRVDGVQSPELPFPASSARHLHTHISFRVCTRHLRGLCATHCMCHILFPFQCSL